MDKPEYTEGICNDGAAILKDGVIMPVEKVVAELNAKADLEERLFNLAMLIRRLIKSMSNHDINPNLRKQAAEYLFKNNLQGDFMRRAINKAVADQDLTEHEAKHPEDKWRGRDHA